MALSDPYAEQALIACILRQPEIFPRLQSRDGDITDKTMATVYRAMLALYADGQPLDLPTLGSWLFDAGQPAGPILAHLTDLVDQVEGAWAWETYDGKVRDAGAKRELLKLADLIKAHAANGQTSAAICGTITDTIRDIVSGGGKNQGLTERIRTVVELCEGTISYQFVDTELGIKTPSEKLVRRKFFCDLVKDGVLKKGVRQGQFVKIDNELKSIDLYSEVEEKEFEIKLPFSIEQYVITYPKNIIIIAGEKNTGKTGMALEITRLNMVHRPVRYLNSEMDRAELKARIKRFAEQGICGMKAWKNVFFSEPKSFLDSHIDPDGLNIIDYLEVTDDFYRVAGRIRDIFDSLNKGVCVICLQKDPKKDLGVGGVFSREKARLYLNLMRGKSAGDYNRCKIDVGKNWRTDQNPEALTFFYQIVQGCRLIMRDVSGLKEENGNDR